MDMGVGEEGETHTARWGKRHRAATGARGRRLERAGSYPKRMRGGLEQEGEESFDAWREMQHKGNRGTNKLRGFHHLRLN